MRFLLLEFLLVTLKFWQCSQISTNPSDIPTGSFTVETIAAQESIYIFHALSDRRGRVTLDLFMPV